MPRVFHGSDHIVEKTRYLGGKPDNDYGNGFYVKRSHDILAVFAMFLLVIGILITSFQIAIYGDPEYRFYQKEYEKYKVTESLDMSIEDVMDVTEYMMDYLIGKEAELSIVTNVDGREQDFFNEQDRLHMEDVKNLFLGGLRVRTVVLVLAVILLGIVLAPKFRERKQGEIKVLLLRAYSIAIGVFLLALAVLGIAFTIDFTACFTIFHKIFFTNDLWMFDPAVDYMIRMLPEGFFADMVLRIVLIFTGLLLAVLAALILWRVLTKRRDEKAFGQVIAD